MSPDIKVEYLSDTAVRLTCLLESSAERIYRAWTTPSEVMKWFTPAGSTCEVAEMDARPGGRYTLAVSTNGERHSTTGHFQALEPYRLIKFTWIGSCGTDEPVVSEVTVELAALEDGTRLTLTHETLASQASRDIHAQGWVGCLTGLSSYLTEL
ncbi:MAG TPA: SRPBCC family protein [Chthonomonadales bacterium]|nr:SRPBCC family protein [Chthonomonadales bacterium]